MNQLEQLERKARLWHIERAASSILRITTGKSLSDYEENELLRLAIERQMITIGEALRRALDVDQTLISQITSVDQIIAFRNQLVHNYPRIEQARVWRIIAIDLPLLLSEVRTALSVPEEAAPSSPEPA